MEYKLKTEPFSHQIEGLNFGMSYDSWFLGDEQGLGKTKQAIDIAINRKEEHGYDHCLIICGVNSLKWNWYNEIHIHSHEDCRILGQRITKSGKSKIGSMNDRLEDLENIDNMPYFIITNIESFRDTKFAAAMYKLSRTKIQMCVFDEAHKCKNPTSQQTKGLMKCQPKCKIAMTGTPIMNSPLDLYVILKWLGYEKHSFYAFKNHYCIMGGFGGHSVIGYRYMEDLSNMLKPIMLRRLKKDVLDLPEKIYVDEYVELTPKQKRIYNEIKTQILKEIDKIALSPSPLASLIRLRQCTGYSGILSTEVTDSAKLDRMLELVDEVSQNGSKCIVFSNWSKVTDEAVIRLKNAGHKPAVITGETDEMVRVEMQETFMTDDECKVIVGTIGAMGTGLTLTEATSVIFLDEPWTRAQLDQAIDRAHRIGTKSNVTIYTLLTKDTIDERIHEIVYKKGKMSDYLIDDEAHDNKTEVLNFLLS